MKPKFTHDSDCCTFLGTLDGIDMYFCGQNVIPTVIARYGDDGDEYMSGAEIAAIASCNGTLRVLCGTPEGTKQPGEKIEMDAAHRALRVAYLIAIDDGLLEAKK